MKNHHSLLAWQEARAVAKSVIDLSASSWKPQFAAVFQQLQKSSLSVQLNIAEGYAFYESPSLRHHLRIAYGSAVETEDLLELMSEYEQFEKTQVASALDACKHSQKLLFGLMMKYRALRDHRQSNFS
jgi:four helix bundle protein